MRQPVGQIAGGGAGRLDAARAAHGEGAGRLLARAEVSRGTGQAGRAGGERAQRDAERRLERAAAARRRAVLAGAAAGGGDARPGAGAVLARGAHAVRARVRDVARDVHPRGEREGHAGVAGRRVARPRAVRLHDVLHAGGEGAEERVRELERRAEEAVGGLVAAVRVAAAARVVRARVERVVVEADLAGPAALVQSRLPVPLLATRFEPEMSR